MVAVEVRGANKLAKVAATIAREQPELRKSLVKGIRKEAGKVRPAMRKNARATLPQSGGMAERAAKTSILIKVRTHGDNVGVLMILKRKGSDIRNLNAGRLRHPLFGDRRHWFNQSVAPRVFSKPFEESAPEIRDGINKVMQEHVDKIRKGAS